MMISKIDNGYVGKATGTNMVFLLSGNLTLSSKGVLHTIKKQHFFTYDEDFEVTTASPYLDGYVISVDEGSPVMIQELVGQVSAMMEPFSTRKIVNQDSKKVTITNLYKFRKNEGLTTSYLHVLLAEIQEDLQNKREELPIFDQFRNLIDENVENNFCAGEYADLLGIPIRDLIYEVHKHTEQTPCSIITERVIHRAKEKLMNTNDSSKMIAYQLGFEDPYYFIKYFKKNVGLTPTQFRKSQEQVEVAATH